MGPEMEALWEKENLEERGWGRGQGGGGMFKAGGTLWTEFI